MDNGSKIQLLENKKIRTAWDVEHETWYFSIVDVIAVLTDSVNPQTYWRIIQSIPSPKAEPFKMWLVRVGSERIDETIDPEPNIFFLVLYYIDKITELF